MEEEKVLDKVRKLLDRANHPATPPGERDMCIRRADIMMSQNAIDMARLDALAKPQERRQPVRREFVAWEGGGWSSQFSTIMGEICRTSGVRAVYNMWGKVVMVGMPEDIGYSEMLWTSVYLSFCSSLDPQWDNDLSFEHNVYNFKRAGRKWEDIAIYANRAGNYVAWPDGGRLIRAYKRHCKILGETPTDHTQRHGAYRQSFADSFETTLCSRLEQMRAERSNLAEESDAGLVLYDAKQTVNNAFYEMFPDRHPDFHKKEREEALVRARQHREQAEQARQEMLARMTDKQRQDFLDKEERQQRRDAAANERYWRQQSERSYDGGGSAAGREAGNKVNLSRSSSVDDNTRKEIG